MRIYPQDLGPRWHPLSILARTHSLGLINARTLPEPPAPRMGRLGRLWSRGAGIQPSEAAAALPAAGSVTVFPLIYFWIWTAILGAIPIGMGLHGALPLAEASGLGAALFGAGGALGLLLPRRLFRRLHEQPLKVEEIEVLLERSMAESDRAFLSLVRDAIRIPDPAHAPEAGENARTAIRALAEALDRLPAVSTEPMDSDAARAEARQLQEQARAETDRVTAESLERQARAVLHRVEAHERSALLAKRSVTLRAEIDAQIAALREGLAALQTEAPDAAGFAFLADAARQVATEAVQLAAAREELDDLLHRRPTLPEAAEGAVLFRKGWDRTEDVPPLPR